MSTKPKTRTRTNTTKMTAKTTKPAAATPLPASSPDASAKAHTDAEDKLWEALRANPNSTTIALAGLAKIGQSTAAKILAKFADVGNVTRIPGISKGGRRAADLWAITADTTPDDVPDDDATQQAAESPQPETTTPDSSTETNEAASADEAAQETSTEPPQPMQVEDAQPTTSTPANSATDTPAEDGTNGKRARLKPGMLHGMVEDYLRANPDDEFGPTKIARDLGGKSSGAVNNALERLVKDGTAVKTKEHPKRFSLAAAVK